MSDMMEGRAEGFRSTLAAGSEEDFDTICDFCQTEGKRVEAIGYCLDCRECLCHECKTIHNRTSTTRKHVILDNLEISKQFAQQNTGPFDNADPLADRCPKHPEEFINIYCNSHQQLGCSVCVPLHHPSCGDKISYIRDVSGEIAGSRDFKNVRTDVKKLVAGLEIIKSRSEWCRHKTNESYDQAVAGVKQLRQRIGQLEESLLNEASRRKNEHLDSFTCQEPRLDVLLKTIKELNYDLDRKCELKHYTQLFITMTYAKERISVLEKEVAHISKTIKPGRFVFSCGDQFNTLTLPTASLGTLSLLCQSDVSAKYLYDINVKASTDVHDCNIAGAAVLSDGRLAVTDWNNKCVKLINVEYRNISEKLSLKSVPIDITMTEDDLLAVTLKDKKHVHILSLSPRLSVDHTINVPGCYRGLSYSEGKLAMACENPVKAVHICDMSGTVVQQIDSDNTGDKLFGTPSRITVSPDKSIIYVSDCDDNKLVLLNNEGVVVTIYQDDMLQHSKGIAVDDNGYVYVCSENEHCVHQLSPSGQLVKILLKKEDGIHYPNAIAYHYGKLLISSSSKIPAHKNKINVFNLE